MNTTKRILLATAAAALSLGFGCRGDVDLAAENRQRQQEAKQETATAGGSVTGKRLDFDQDGRLQHEERPLHDDGQQGIGGSGPAGDCDDAEASPTGTCEGGHTVQPQQDPK